MEAARKESKMPRKLTTERIAEVIGFEPLTDGCAYIVFRDVGGTEYGVKVPKELLARLTIVSASAFHDLAQSGAKRPGEAPLGQAFGLWTSQAVVDPEGRPYLRLELDTGLPLGLQAGREEAVMLQHAVGQWIELIETQTEGATRK